MSALTTSTTLSFAPSDRAKAFSVPVFGDTAREGNEVFRVNLSNASGASIADARGIGTILDDEGLNVGTALLLPEKLRIAADEAAALTLRWAHPETWHDLATVDLRLVDDEGVAFWARFDEQANTLGLCDREGSCGPGLPPGTLTSQSRTAQFSTSRNAPWWGAAQPGRASI